MQPAARVTDQTGHGTPLVGPGSPTVFIGGLPAWRALVDVHSCPLVDPSGNPHVGGVAQPGSTSVLINNMPAARMGDSIAEAGSPNAIVAGCMNVLIG